MDKRDQLKQAIVLMEQSDFLHDQLVAATELLDRLQNKELIVSVIGQFKRGKSSLVNALLGEELLPVGIVPLTTVATEIRKSLDFRASVQLNDGSETEVERNELVEYISEQLNSGNHKQVAVVKLWTRHMPFDDGITLVDTPGVGSVHEHNTRTSQAYIEKSDVVLFLLSVDSPVSETERDLLLKTRAYAAKFFYVVNKADIISEDDLREYLSYCTKVLNEATGTEVVLYPVSVKTGEGIDALL